MFRSEWDSAFRDARIESSLDALSHNDRHVTVSRDCIVSKATPMIVKQQWGNEAASNGNGFYRCVRKLIKSLCLSRSDLLERVGGECGSMGGFSPTLPNVQTPTRSGVFYKDRTYAKRTDGERNCSMR